MNIPMCVALCVLVGACVHGTEIWTKQGEQTFEAVLVAIIVPACYVTRRHSRFLTVLDSFKIQSNFLTHICWTIRKEIRFIGASGQHTKTDKPRSIEPCARVRDS
jgi:hypothetical protein